MKNSAYATQDRPKERQIVHIDEELCNGCGACVSPCAEGAIQIIDGKARVLHEELCDGAGFCLGVCPTGALSIETREAVAFDEHAAEAEMKRRGKTYIEQTCHVCGQGEDSRVLIPCRKTGASLWVCTRCLPALIHG
ncbi:MAG: 4Fe-4S binding protein [Chloroflexota bacterium]|nr:4Fe-4S binding protein [Chloroflexota bacterium]